MSSYKCPRGEVKYDEHRPSYGYRNLRRFGDKDCGTHFKKKERHGSLRKRISRAVKQRLIRIASIKARVLPHSGFLYFMQKS